MRILNFGGTGMLGHKLVQKLSADHEIFATVRSNVPEKQISAIFDRATLLSDIDVTDDVAIASAFDAAEPELVINAVGLIKQLIDDERTLDALLINSVFPQKLARICEQRTVKLISISTDCVFNGKQGNYSETDLSDADDVHGKTKFLGEVTNKNCLTIRTSIIGRELHSSHSLLEWFLSNRGTTVEGYKRAMFSGFPTVVLADIIADLVVREPFLSGLYHIASEPISKFDLLSLINEIYDCGTQIVANDEFAVDRSLDGTKFCRETGFRSSDWRSMIEAMAADTTDYELIRK